MKEFDASGDEERLSSAAGAGIVVREGCDDGRIFDWENGLPSEEDLTPLSVHLVPPELASAFGIPPAHLKSMLDVHLASQKTISNLTIRNEFSSSPSLDSPVNHFGSGDPADGYIPVPIIPDDLELSPHSEITERLSEEEIAAYPSEIHGENPLIDQRALKRPRLVWKPQLHKRFVEAVTHLGAKNAVPKTIMQLMNVDGLSRENIASHLQKYRLYLKRMQEFSDEGTSSSDHGDASSPNPVNIYRMKQQQHPQPEFVSATIPTPAYGVPPMFPMPIYTFPHPHYQSYGMVMFNGHQGGTPCHEFDARRGE